ncbi:molybdopterin-dependent oxidoreductase [Colwellia sp. MSW7]|uniref:Molybdopterin-dependent oxidoreductase n=1 Tax=Colwellia maritima TaxID=2912588 RepID=A0ABS9X5S8_9GAMM|nr:molybdopterin-dependent oxidoreductase [Colwellia maritima]MCI2285595.1 molybdopterin-dependent oxidoreductase [Colwellia maritima]
MSKNTITTHWGMFKAITTDNTITSIENFSFDEYPSKIGQSLLNAQDSNTRIDQPYIRASFLEKNGMTSGKLRGKEAFVPVDWNTALTLAAKSLQTVKDNYSNEAIYGGSYGWASAGRFHHSLGQVHRFLNKFGGYVSSRDTYSLGVLDIAFYLMYSVLIR